MLGVKKLFSAPFLLPRRPHLARNGQQAPRNNGMIPAMVKVVNVISDIGHGAQKVAKKVSKDAQPLIDFSAAQWRRTVDDHIMPNVKTSLDFVGQKAVEGVDSLADAVMGPQAKQETSQALKTLHRALNNNGTLENLAEEAVN